MTKKNNAVKVATVAPIANEEKKKNANAVEVAPVEEEKKNAPRANKKNARKEAKGAPVAPVAETNAPTGGAPVAETRAKETAKARETRAQKVAQHIREESHTLSGVLRSVWDYATELEEATATHKADALAIREDFCAVPPRVSFARYWLSRSE